MPGLTREQNRLAVARYRKAHPERHRKYRQRHREGHKDQINARQREYMKKYRETHGKDMAKYQKAYREAHKEERKAYARKYYEANKESLNAAAVMRGRKHYTNNRESLKERRKQVRLDALVHYSKGAMCCACCGEGIVEFLALDHIKGDGGQVRKRQGGSGHTYYKWLKRNGYPPGLQVLCHNCNCAKGFYGKCPHKAR